MRSSSPTGEDSEHENEKSVYAQDDIQFAPRPTAEKLQSFQTQLH